MIRSFDDESICVGTYVHVFVNPKEGDATVRIPEEMRRQFERISPATKSE